MIPILKYIFSSRIAQRQLFIILELAATEEMIFKFIEGVQHRLLDMILPSVNALLLSRWMYKRERIISVC